MRYSSILVILLLLASCSNSDSQNIGQSSPTNSPPSTSESPTQQSDSFAEGVNKATNAATLAQTAKSSDEWGKVAAEWQSAINLMGSVPSSSPNFKVAKQRAEAYQKNLAYAQQNVTRSQQDQIKLQQAQIIRGEKVFKDLKGTYQVVGEATATPIVQAIVPRTGWRKISASDRVSLSMYAESLISVVKSNPSKYVSVPASSPVYNRFVSQVANLCQDCWSITVSYKDSQPYSVDETIVQGDTAWTSADPCCRGIKASEFRQ